MGKFLSLIAFVGLSHLVCVPAYAEEVEEPKKTEAPEKAEAPEKDEASDSKKADWNAEVQKKYNLTDAQMESMTSKGMKGPELAKVAQLAESSKKPISEIVSMRTEQKMGWGKIAKTLGVTPKELGQAVAGMHRNKHEDKHETKHEDKRESREARRQERQMKKEEKGNKGKGPSH